MDHNEKIYHKLEIVHQDVTEIKEILSDQKSILAVQSEQIKEHIRRTNLLEEELKPIKSHVAVVNFLAKALVVAVSAGSAVGAIIKVFVK